MREGGSREDIWNFHRKSQFPKVKTQFPMGKAQCPWERANFPIYFHTKFEISHGKVPIFWCFFISVCLIICLLIYIFIICFIWILHWKARISGRKVKMFTENVWFPTGKSLFPGFLWKPKFPMGKASNFPWESQIFHWKCWISHGKVPIYCGIFF